MAVDRVKLKDVLSSQIPSYVKDDFPLLVTFLEEYYNSQETQGGTLDLIENLDQYVKVDELANLKLDTTLSTDIDADATSIPVSDISNFTYGFPEENGLIQIDDEIIRYGHKTSTTFENCVRGFSGVKSYTSSLVADKQDFVSTTADAHSRDATIKNLNVLFLQEFLTKLKTQITPGFEDRPLADDLNQKNFIKSADSFYKTKGTDESFKILFKAVYGVDVEVIKPNNLLVRPSDADYRISQDFVVEGYVGDPLDLKNRTIFQKTTNARGTVTRVEKLPVDGDFYQISIDTGYQRDIDVDGTIFGKFEPNAKTKLLNDVGVGATFIDVDSTIDFPKTGSLSLVDTTGEEFLLSYTDKNLTQFIGLTTTISSFSKTSDVRIDDYSFVNTGVGTESQIRVRVLNTLKEVDYLEDNFGFNKGDRISIKSLGVLDNTTESSWYYNIKGNCKVKSLSQSNTGNTLYNVTVHEPHMMKIGQKVVLTNTDLNQSYDGTITSIDDNLHFVIKFNVTIPSIQLINDFTIENQLLKGNSTKYANLKNITANILNIYKKKEDYLVASNGVPNYDDDIRPDSKTYTFSGSANFDQIQLTTTEDHGLFSGDAVYYSHKTIITPYELDGQTFYDSSISQFTNVEEGVYFISRVSAFNVKLAKSQADLYNGKFIAPKGSVTDNKLTYYPFYQKSIQSQKIFREINNPIQKAGTFLTRPGKTGVLLNGVEIENYKSSDVIFYGGIKSFEITSPGKNYDVINPPVLSISDAQGSGASGTISVTGSLSEMRVLNKGFDYIDTPVIRISGGNPDEDAVAQPNMIKVDHEVVFPAGLVYNNLDGGVDFTNNYIGFATFHNLRDNEQIVYNPNKGRVVTGLNTSSTYYVRIIDGKRIALHSTFSDSQSGINTISITATGIGDQSFKAVKQKQVVSSIVVSNAGSGYKNKERTIVSSGINTSTDVITIKKHGYKTNEIIRYTPTGTAIGGISSTSEYFVKTIDDDSFCLFEVGTGSQRRFNVDNNVPVNITKVGDGYFNYPPITVTVEGSIGINTSFGQDITCAVQPIFRGEIDSASITSTGVGYGSSEIINLDRRPVITLKSGEGAQLTAVVNNGSITEVVVNNGGSGYNSPPEIIVSKGKYCRLTPVIKNGKIDSVTVVHGGIGYTNDSLITVVSSGIDGSISANINNWTVNKFEQKLNKLTDDDTILTEGFIDGTLQLAHLYLPRNIRKTLYGKKSDGTVQYQYPDLKLDSSGTEEDTIYHSPIIGWSYCGSPIYGPFGYDTPEGGRVRRMVSGYEVEVSPNRPPLQDYPLGFFVEDYVFRDNGDLNESNGRFCITPDFPNGRFCYFATYRDFNDGSGAFRNLRRPEFPYLIGNTYQHSPNLFNFKSESNHNDYDLVTNGWRRITSPYNMNSNYGGYDYIYNSNKIKEQTLDITSVSKGSIVDVGIFTGGFNYQIDDKVTFNGDTNGKAARGKVDVISGKYVNTVDVTNTFYENVEYINVGYNQKFVGFMTAPHGLEDQAQVKVNGLSNYFAGFDGYYKVGISTGSYVLLNDVANSGVTGLVTYFSVGGAFQYPFMRPNDIIDIENEKVKILNSDPLNGRVRILRAQGGTTGAAHTGNVKLFQDPRSFTINVGALKTTKNLRLNTELYFDPSETLGIGTLGTVGAGVTVVFSNPGAGATNLFIEERKLFIPDHGLKINDELSYHTNTGTSIEVWNGQAGVPKVLLSSYGTLYAAPFSVNLVGISTNKVGVASDGFVGINTTTNLLYFTDPGTNVYHSLKSNFSETVTSEVERTSVTVATAQTHGLRVSDKVFLTINPKESTTIVVKYNDFNRRIVFDPYTFASGDVNTTFNSIGVSTGSFTTGDKVIHTSASPAGGLVNEKMYYVYANTPSSVKLVENQYELKKVNPSFVDITSAASGTISKINPRVNADCNIKFDLSDTSLSFTSNGTQYPAFEMKIFTDALFINQYFSTGEQGDFAVTKSGTVGVDGQLTIASKNIPFSLYYNFANVNKSFLPNEKIANIDKSVISYNTIFRASTPVDGSYSVTSIGTTTYSFDIKNIAHGLSFNRTTSDPEYNTNSKSAYGSIKNVTLVDNNYGYESVPGINSIRTGIGTGAILFAETKDIGKIGNQIFTSNNIGWNYPTDNTLKPTANLPEIVEVDALASFEKIEITSSGIDYLVPAKLVVRDGVTNDLVDVDLNYQLGDPEVNIISNTRGMHPTTPRIVPTNNSNGFAIGSLTYTGNTVKLDLTNQFSSDDEYPFSIGSRVLVENVNIGIGTTGKGYNSEQYKHQFFTVVGVKTNAGGSGAYVEYSLEDVLKTGEVPGNVVSLNSASVVPESYLPSFNSILTKNEFIENEFVTWGTKQGIVETYDAFTDIVKFKSAFDINIGDRLVGSSSKTIGVVSRKWEFDADIKTGAGATVYYGWQKNTGFLNESNQKLPDNEYYQRFSYSVKSEVPFSKWDNTVGSLNHTSGFKKFSDLQIISQSNSTLKPTVNDSEVSFIVDVIGEGDLNCWYDFDFAKENLLNSNGTNFSDTVFFENVVLSDYFESVGNRVLEIDNLSDLFDNRPRFEKFAQINTFSEEIKFVKSIFFVQDTAFVDEKQFTVGTCVVDDNRGYSSSYAVLQTFPYLGYFDLNDTVPEWGWTFHPVKFEYNNYFVSSVNFAIGPALTGAASTAFGDIAYVDTQEVNVPTGSTTNVVSVGTTFRALKVMNLLVHGDDHHFAEFNIVHNNGVASMIEYGNIDESTGISSGIGTFEAVVSGLSVLLRFIPNAGIAATSYSQIIGITQGSSTTGFVSFASGKVGSGYTSIPSSGSPTEHIVTSYDTSNPVDIQSGYHFISVEDTANNQYEIFELGSLTASIDNNQLPPGTQHFVEFGGVQSHGLTIAGLGTVGLSTSGVNLNVVYTPNPGIAVEVKSFDINPRELDSQINFEQIDLMDGYINAQSGNYFGTKSGLKTKFNLTHKGDQIFQRMFDGSSNVAVSTDTNSISLPNHFFQSGEAVKYTFDGSSTRIQIVSTDFGGSVGSTTLLPTDLFVIKVDDAKIGFATNAKDAQALNPTFVQFDSVGTGNSHFITAQNQNSKGIITIDNMVQAPVSKTGITATLTQNITFDTNFTTSGITTIKANDIIKIDDEFMKVTSVTGTGTTMFVVRPMLGSVVAPHSSGSTIELFKGNYTITDNSLNFVDAPHGLNPIATTTGSPDQRDFSGLVTSSTFSGRIFTKRGVTGSSNETYFNNRVFDDVSGQFTGIRSEFTLTSEGANVSGITSNTILLINNIFQAPQGVQADQIGEYQNFESAGVTTAQFTSGLGTPTGYDVNKGAYPIGGMIVSVGSDSGFGYQPLVGAGGTAVVSTAGTITSVSIGNSGSGYRTGVVTAYTVGVQTYNGVVPVLEHIGTAIVSNGNIVSVHITNPGSGYTSTNAPVVVIDEPLSYTGIPLQYSSGSTAGVGSEASIDITVGQGSSVIDFEINNFGFGFARGERLTVPVGGTTGIPTNTSLTFDEFTLEIQDTYSDSFLGYSPGEFQVFDRIDDRFNDVDKVFPLTIGGNPVSIRAAANSNIEVDQTLLVFINDILQVPGESYTFEGGSQIIFNEAPKGPGSGIPEGDTSRILFYKGGGINDVVFRDIMETIKIGDSVKLDADIEKGQSVIFNQNRRVLTGINTIDAAQTNSYFGPGVSQDKTLLRPLTWCKQTLDRKIQGQFVGKDRVKYEPSIFPASYLIQPVSTASTIVYVDSVRPLFDGRNEQSNRSFQDKIKIVSQDVLVGASATATVSAGGTISTLTLTGGGQGYRSSPSVSIGRTTGVTTTATATASITSGVVTNFTITDNGSGYVDAPVVLIEEPSFIKEDINVSAYQGDNGIIVGFGTTSYTGKRQVIFDFYIPNGSFMRDTSVVGSAVTISGISTGDFFTAFDTNMVTDMSTVVALATDNTTTIGITTDFLDGVYQAERSIIVETNVVGVGTTFVRRVFANISGVSTISFSSSILTLDSSTFTFDSQTATVYSGGIASAFNMGKFSWGKITLGERVSAQDFPFYGLDGHAGISSSGLVQRYNPLKFKNYI